MTAQEKSVTCFDCGSNFIFSVEEQEAFKAKGYQNAPKRCPACRESRKARQLASGNYGHIQPGFRVERQLFPATCAQCGKSTQVPFEPREGRPVYCRDCYSAMRTAR
jgi:CxxC-x17-CxxC domain-containing protein